MKKRNVIHNLDWKEQMLAIAVLDVLTIFVSYAMALMLRFEFSFSAIDTKYVEGFLDSILLWILATLVVFFVCRLYHSIWSLASTRDLLTIIKAYVLLIPVYVLIAHLLRMNMPRSYYVMGYIINFCLRGCAFPIVYC